MNFFIKILDILFPRKCLGCEDTGSFLCINCARNALSDEVFFEDCKIVFSYRDPIIRNAIHMLKYKGKKSIAEDLAKSACLRFENFLSEIKQENGYNETIIIPLPMHTKRQKERGYNQAELIAKELIKISNVKNVKLRKDILKKVKETKTQVSTKNKTERTKNMKDCFEIFNSKNIQNIKNAENKNIIILDDIITTGSTLYEAKKTLTKEGIKNIFLFALAH